MLYRMKQNAVGLANICILSTMVLVTISSTCSLWFGAGRMIHSRYPHDVMAYVYGDELTEAFDAYFEKWRRTPILHGSGTFTAPLQRYMNREAAL